MSAQSDVSDLIASAWTAAPKSASGLADGVDADNTMIRAMTDAIAGGIVSALPTVPSGLPLKGWLYAALKHTADISSGIGFEEISSQIGWAIVAPASLGARVLIAFSTSQRNSTIVPYRLMTARSTPGGLTILSSDFVSSNTTFNNMAQTLALAF